jgi:hypothetical protein
VLLEPDDTGVILFDFSDIWIIQTRGVLQESEFFDGTESANPSLNIPD